MIVLVHAKIINQNREFQIIHTNSNSNQFLNQLLLETQKKIRQLIQARLDAKNMQRSLDIQI